MSAKDIARKFFEELGVTQTAQGLKDFVKKHYDANVVQSEAGQAERKGLDAVLAAEGVFFDQYLDYKAQWPKSWVEVHSIYADGNVTFSEQTLTMPLNGMGTIVQKQLVESHWDLKTGKLTKEVFWHLKK